MIHREERPAANTLSLAGHAKGFIRSRLMRMFVVRLSLRRFLATCHGRSIQNRRLVCLVAVN
jgi:hypothetical protein